MTISTELRKAGPFAGNGATTAFPFSFKVFAATDATVTVANTQGNESVLALGADYAVALNADQDAAPGGTVTLAAPLASGHRLVVSSAVPNLQPTDITNNGGFYPRVIEDALDRHVVQIQQIDEKVARALKVAITSPLGDQALPSPAAGMLIGWNESSDGLKNYAPIGGTLLGQQLAAANGSSLVGFQQSGTGSVLRTAQDKMREWVSVKDFGAVGDGVADDTIAIQNAINAATAVGKNLYAPKGTYKLTTQLQVTCGLIGDGSSNTIFQAVNNGTAAGWSILITGGSLFEGFTTDGACSADPVSWDSGNLDSFTGWRPFFMSGINGCVVRDVIGQNSALGAPIRIESCQDIIVENCQAIRGRGNFGDGFYTHCARRVNFVNCRAYDVTRIGFVCEGTAGGVIQVSEQVAFTCCHAEYAHDQSISYGGGEINAGFWFENSTLTTCTDCTTKNTGDRGFTYAGTALVGTAGFHVCQAHYINCHADGSNTGFSLASFTPSVPALVTADNCSVINSVQDFSVSYGKFLLNHCSSRKDGGGDQSRAVTAGTDAEVYINNFFEHWTNKPAYLTDPAVDAGSVGKFSVNHPKRIVIDNYTTYDGAALSLKLRVATAITDLSIRNSRFFSAVARLGSINVANCVVDYSTIHPQTNLFVTGTKMLGRFYVVDDAAGALKRIATCEFSRSNEADYLLEFFSGNDIPKPLIFVSNCNFNGNLEIGNKFVRVGSSTVTASSPRAHDIYVDGCTLYNTGGTTANVGIELTRADDASRAYVTSTWKSSTITTIATRTATNSTFGNV